MHNLTGVKKCSEFYVVCNALHRFKAEHYFKFNVNW